RFIRKQLVAQLVTQPPGGQVPQTPFSGQRVARVAATQQLLMQVEPIAQTDVSWQVCVLQAAVLETQAPPEQMVFSAQSTFWVHDGWQRGWLGSRLQLSP